MKTFLKYGIRLTLIGLISTIALSKTYCQDLSSTEKKELIYRLQLADSLSKVVVEYQNAIDSLVSVKEELKEQVSNLKTSLSVSDGIINNLNDQKREYKTREELLNKELRRQRSPISVGLSAGLGMTNTSFAPYIGLGVNISLFKIIF